MKNNRFKLLLFFIGLVAIAGTTFVSCNDKNEDAQQSGKTNIITGALTYDSGCKGSYESQSQEQNSSRISGDTLFISKVNVGYVSDVDNMYLATNISNDTLYVFERWHNAGSNYICKRDINLYIANIPQGSYTVCNCPLFLFSSDTTQADWGKEITFRITIQ